MRSWEVNDDAWEAFQKAEDMCAGIQAAYEAGIRAASDAPQPEPEYEYEYARENRFGRVCEPDYSLEDALIRAERSNWPDGYNRVVRRVKDGAWEPVPNQSNGSEP